MTRQGCRGVCPDMQVLAWSLCRCRRSAQGWRRRAPRATVLTGADIAADALAEEQVAHAAQRFLSRMPKPG